MYVRAVRCGVICTRLPSISVRIFIKVNKCVFETTIFEIANADWICYCCCGYTCHCCCRRLIFSAFGCSLNRFKSHRLLARFYISAAVVSFYCIQHIDYIILLLDFPLFSEDASLSLSGTIVAFVHVLLRLIPLSLGTVC